jgi:hypothetical protein
MQMMLHGFARRACRGTCHTFETDFRRGRRPFCYPNPGVTLRTFPSDRRHFRCRHVRDPMTDNADFSEFRNIQHWRQLLRRTLEPYQGCRQLFFPGVVKLRPLLKMYLTPQDEKQALGMALAWMVHYVRLVPR